MDALADDDLIVLGGPLEDEYRVVHAIDAESPKAIRARLAEDPWSETHLHIVRCDSGLAGRVRGGSRRPEEQVACPHDQLDDGAGGVHDPDGRPAWLSLGERQLTRS
jgi:hypothetical protein